MNNSPAFEAQQSWQSERQQPAVCMVYKSKHSCIGYVPIASVDTTIVLWKSTHGQKTCLLKERWGALSIDTKFYCCEVLYTNMWLLQVVNIITTRYSTGFPLPQTHTAHMHNHYSKFGNTSVSATMQAQTFKSFCSEVGCHLLLEVVLNATIPTHTLPLISFCDSLSPPSLISFLGEIHCHSW